MANNKVVLGNETLIDLTSDTATEETVLEGYTFHSADGQLRTGSAVAGGGDDKMDIDGENADTSVTFPNSALTIGSRATSFELGESFKWTDLTRHFEVPIPVSNGVVYNNRIHVFGYGVQHYSWSYTDPFTWIYESSLPYSISDSTAVVVYDNKIHILGGGAANDNHYSWDGTEWKSESTLPYLFSNGCAVEYHGNLHILGGEINGDYGYSRKHYSWDGTSWIQRTNIPYDFSGAAAVVSGDCIHIFGSEYSSYYKRHYSWNGLNWSTSKAVPYNVYYERAVVYHDEQTSYYDDKIYLLGNGYDTTNVFSYYDCRTGAWNQSLGGLPYDFQRACAVIYNDNIYIISSGYSIAQYQMYWYPLPSPSTWIKPMESLPESIPRGKALEYNNKLYIFQNYAYYYDDEEETWVKSGAIGSSFTTMATYNNKVYFMGNGSTKTNIFYQYDGTSLTSAGTLPFKMFNGLAVVYDNKLHVFFGSSNNTSINAHYCWDGTNWEYVGTTPYDNCMYGCAITYNNEIHILGGEINDSYGYSRKHYSWDGTSWIQRNDLPYNFRSGYAFIYNNKLHIMGSNSTDAIGMQRNILYWDNITDKWILLPVKTPFDDAFKGTSVIHNDKLYLFQTTYFYEGDPSLEIIEVEQSQKSGTVVQGYQSMAEGNYSLARGSNCLAEGNYSKAEGINAYAQNDFQSVSIGSSNKVVSGEFAFGRSLFNHIFYSSNTKQTSINGVYGYSGTIYKNVEVYIKIDFYGLYILYRASINSGTSAGTVYFINGNQCTYVGSSSTFVAQIFDNIILRLSSNPTYDSQFTLIRLA